MIVVHHEENHVKVSSVRAECRKLHIDIME
jgi:hypothetical protein